MIGSMSDDAMSRAKATFEQKEETKLSDGPAFDIEGYLDHYGVKWRKQSNGDGLKFILVNGCPFNPDHKGKDAAVFLRANGARGFKCLHDGCSDKHWADFKQITSGNDDLSPYTKDGKKRAEERQANRKLDPSDPSIFVSVSSLLDVEEPNRPDLWEGEIPQGSLVGISGQWGSMKSYLMQALGLRAAQGQPFLGRRLVETDVFYFDLENPRTVWKRRLLDLAGQDRPDRFHMMTLFGPYPPPRFDADGMVFYSKLAEIYPDGLFIYDSLVRFYPSGKQTEGTEDSIHAMTALKSFTRWGTTVGFLHHPTKNGGNFRGGGDLQAAPDLLFSLSHDKKARRLTLECTKNRFDEGHTLEIGYEVTPEGGLVFVDMATAEEMKRRSEDRQRTAAVFEIIKELYPRGESTKRGLLEECNKRLNMKRKVAERVIDNGVGAAWTCTKMRTKHIYAPLCSDDLNTRAKRDDENPCDSNKNERVHDDRTHSEHKEHDPNVSVFSVFSPFRENTRTHTGTSCENDESEELDFPPEEDLGEEVEEWNC